MVFKVTTTQGDEWYGPSTWETAAYTAANALNCPLSAIVKVEHIF